ncbi:unnamed protein product [Victoria cruziana]
MADFNADVDILWGRDHTMITNPGQEIRLSLDGVSGSRFQSKQEFLYGRFDMKIKLVPGNSAGTVTTFYQQFYLWFDPTTDFHTYSICRLHSSIWNADWATRGGLVKVDWAQAPFTAAFRDLVLDAQLGPGVRMSAADQEKLAWVRKNYMIYNYCTNAKRFPEGWPRECSLGLYS